MTASRVERKSHQPLLDNVGKADEPGCNVPPSPAVMVAVSTT
jgi:hypothetical protein